jgi:hypothetical protein
MDSVPPDAEQIPSCQPQWTTIMVNNQEAIYKNEENKYNHITTKPVNSNTVSITVDLRRDINVFMTGKLKGTW